MGPKIALNRYINLGVYAIPRVSQISNNVRAAKTLCLLKQPPGAIQSIPLVLMNVYRKQSGKGDCNFE